MKYLKGYKIFEMDKTIDIKYLKSLINFELINDLKDLAIEYIDEGDELEEYSVSLNVCNKAGEFLKVDNTTHKTRQYDLLLYCGYFNHSMDVFDDISSGENGDFWLDKRNLENFLDGVDKLSKDFLTKKYGELTYKIKYSFFMMDNDGREIQKRLQLMYPNENIDRAYEEE